MTDQETDTGVKYPHVHVKLTDEDGNAFAIIRRVQRALGDGGVCSEYIQRFTDEATSGGYDHLLQTVMRTVETS